MKIVNCLKGGRIPEGYCRKSCLNYSRNDDGGKCTSLQNAKKILHVNRRSLSPAHNEDII